MTTLLVQDRMFERHSVPSGHPERPERLQAVRAALEAAAFDPLVRREAAEVGEADLLAVHPPSHIRDIRAMSQVGGMAIDPDTWAGPESYRVARLAAGSACAAVDAVVAGEVRNAFVASRPPGHHAEAELAMGFCLFNNAVIAARHAQRVHGRARVAIVDWDVHHGNGTQALVWTDPTILYASTHQMPLFPGTGAGDETGVGNVFNVPLTAGTDGPAFRRAFAARIVPPLSAFAPDFVVISAGFDAHRRDPLGGLELDAADFAWATRAVMEVAGDTCGGALASLLEGGYDLDGLADSVAAHVAELMRG